MLRNNFDETIHKTLVKHGYEDEKLEAILIDLFKYYEQRMLSSDFVGEITRQQTRTKNRRSKLPR